MYPNRISRAAIAVDQIQKHVGTALEHLDQGFSGRIVNGYGIYTDVFSRKSNLAIAIDNLQRADALLNETSWPMEKDYDEF